MSYAICRRNHRCEIGEKPGHGAQNRRAQARVFSGGQPGGIGGNETAVKILNDTEKGFHNSGFYYTGFISTKDPIKALLTDRLTYLGNLDDLETAIDKHKIKQVVIALEKTEHDLIEKIIERISDKEVEINRY